MKRILNVMILLCLALNLLPMAAFAEETETTEATEAAAAIISREPGLCGDGLTWNFSGNTLTISGSGEMDDYSTEAPPWANHRHDIRNVVFTGGVSYVGANAFTDYDEIETVDFGSAMHTIGEQAFYLCDGLTQIILPATFRCFSQECFMGCQNLKSVYCLGGMPSFRGSCLWDTGATVYYPTNNPWPADPVQQLLNSYQFKITIQPGTAPAQQTAAPAVIETTEPPATEAPTVPETTVPPTTEAATIPTTEATEVTQATTAPTTRPTEPQWLRETQAAEEEPEAEKKGISTGLLVGICLITGTLSLILIGALVFRRRSY